MSWVLQHSESTLADRLVLLAIANHADATGCNAWPSRQLIAAEARVSISTVKRSVAALVDLGELEVSRQGAVESHADARYRTNAYRLPALSPGGSECTPSGGASTPGRGRNRARSGGSPVAREPSVEPSWNQRGRFARDSGLNPAAAQAVMERNRRRAVGSACPGCDDEGVRPHATGGYIDCECKDLAG